MPLIISKNSVSARPEINNLNALLNDIYVRHVAIKEEDFRLYYKVFSDIFLALHKTMKEVDPYYERFASDIKYNGSHFDNLRIKKPDEFDMLIVIDLPVNMDKDHSPFGNDDIQIQPHFPGYVQLRAGTQYQNLPNRDLKNGQVYTTPYNWMDKKKFIRSSEFISWFKGVGAKALNKFRQVKSKPVFKVDGVDYVIGTSESGPAWTLIIEAPGFKLDVDMVPALKFPESRWLKGKRIRAIPDKCKKGYWMLVAKPNKDGHTKEDQLRSWRIAMPEQEREFLNNTFALRQTMRLMKQLRDSLDLTKLTSYFIKNMFYNEIVDLKAKHPAFWEHNDIATLFKHMVEKLYKALSCQEIPYFWNRRQNFIKYVNRATISQYRSRVSELRNILILNSSKRYKEVAKYLLSPSEYVKYEKFLI